MRIGFIGLGHMGLPMATNLALEYSGFTVWNRTLVRAEALRDLGVFIARSPDEVFARCDVVLLMLANKDAVDEVLGRGTTRMRSIAERIVVNMGTTAPGYSLDLARDIGAVGGEYVEAPVSGSQVPAQDGQLIAMLAGDERAMAVVRPLLEPMCKQSVVVGPIPQALEMKLAVNTFLITQVLGLVEAFCLATRHDLDPEKFREIVDSGPMASDVSRMKLAKLLEHDYSTQAGLADVHYNTELIMDAAYDVELDLPLLGSSQTLLAHARESGCGGLDMVAVARMLDGNALDEAEDYRSPRPIGRGGG